MKPQIKKLLCLMLVLSLSLSLASGVVAQQAQFAAPKLVANTSFLNIRTGPGAHYSVLITVVGGTELPVLGVANDRVWYQVSTVAGVGWVNVNFTLPRGDFSVVPLVEAPPVAGLDLASLGQGGGGGAVAAPTGGIRGLSWGVSILGGDLHAGPGDTTAKVRTVLGEDRSTIYPLTGSAPAQGTIWYQFSVPGIGSGWMPAHQLMLRPLICGAGPSAVLLTQQTGMQSGPDGVNAPPYVLNGGQELYALEARAGLVKIQTIGGDVGWVPIELTQGRDESRLKSVCAGVVTSGSGVVGVPGSVAPAVPAAPAVPHVVINTAFLNVRSGPGAQFSTVATLPGGTELPVLGIANDNVWYLVQGAFGQGWINIEFALFRGDRTNLPIIRNAVGTLARPTATINGVVTLYATPNTTLGTVGAVSGPVQVDVVARTSDNAWVQINTAIGFGWVPASQVVIGGDLGLAPVVQ